MSLFPQENFNELIELVTRIIPSQKPQNYLAIFLVFTQKIDARISREGPIIQKEGAVVPPEITKSRGFTYLKTEILPKILKDHVLSSLVYGNEDSLTESTSITRTMEKIDKISKSILIACRTDAQKCCWDAACGFAWEKLINIKDRMEGSFSFAYDIVHTDAPSHFDTTNSTGRSFPDQLETIFIPNECLLQLESTLKISDLTVREKTFEHGETTEQTLHLSITTEEEKINITQTLQTSTSEITDLRMKKDSFYTFRSDGTDAD